MVFTNQTLGRAASLSHGGNEAARDTVVSVFDHQSSTLPPAGKAMSRSDRNPDRSDRADGWRSAVRILGIFGESYFFLHAVPTWTRLGVPD